MAQMGMNLFLSFQCFPTLALCEDLSCSLTSFIAQELRGAAEKQQEGLSIRANLHSFVESVNQEKKENVLEQQKVVLLLLLCWHTSLEAPIT